MTAMNDEPLVTTVALANRSDDPTCAVYPERSRGVHRAPFWAVVATVSAFLTVASSLPPASPTCGGPARLPRAQSRGPLSGGSLPRRSLAGDALRGNENKSLTAISNRNTNERRNAATHSESTISKFLIATKMHFSEEKAKSEEKTNPSRTCTVRTRGYVAEILSAKTPEFSMLAGWLLF